MFYFGLGNLFYGESCHTAPTGREHPGLTRFLLAVSILLVNAVAVLSEDRFLARSTHSQNLRMTHKLLRCNKKRGRMLNWGYLQSDGGMPQ